MILAAAFLIIIIRFWRVALAAVICVTAVIFVFGVAAGLSLVWH